MREICGVWYENNKIPEGSKIWFEEEKQGYTVRASNVAFAICTKPMNALKTVIYTVIDWQQNIRGTENLIFGMGAETDEQCKDMLERLTNGDSEVSERNFIKLNIKRLDNIKLKPQN